MRLSAAIRELGLGLLLWGLCFAQNPEPGPPVTIRYPKPGGHERIMDAAFPLLPATLKDALTVITIRFNPSFYPDSQLELVVKEGSPSRVRYARAAVGYSEAVMLAQRDFSESAVVRAMGVEEQSFTVSQQYCDDAVSGFWQAIADSSYRIARESLTRAIQVDGTEYRVFIQSRLTSVTLVVQGDEVGTPDHAGRLPIVRWMNGLHNEFETRFKEAESHGKRSP